MLPARSGRPRPPLVHPAQVDGPRVRWKTIEPAREVLRRREGGRVERVLGDGDVARVGDERRELAIGDRVRVDPEAVDLDGRGPDASSA